ncbi:hypothetical protein OG780_14235 [Streptomyces sp. NBC_00386]|uniref:hypothetical protein n=1 Tax=Streptomyces sp. NBC_00386 TaxID=2975734 RepID=UPI002E20C1C9
MSGLSGQRRLQHPTWVLQPADETDLSMDAGAGAPAVLHSASHSQQRRGSVKKTGLPAQFGRSVFAGKEVSGSLTFKIHSRDLHITLTRRTMRLRIGAALIAATMLPLFAAPAADAAPAPSASWAFSNGPRVNASSKVTLNYSIANLPKGSHVELRREAGSSHTYKTINTLKAANGKGSVTTTAPTQGRWGYRIYILNSNNAKLAEAGHYLYAYSNVSITKFFNPGQHYTSGSITIGNRLMQYKTMPFWTEKDVFATSQKNTCRSISLQIGRLRDYGNATGKRTVKVVQTSTSASVKVPYNSITTLSTKLTGSAFALHVNEDPDSSAATTYATGTASCYTASGF